MTLYVLRLLLKFYALVALEVVCIWLLYLLMLQLEPMPQGAFVACLCLSIQLALMNVVVFFDDPYATWLRTQD